ncbi:Uncharacterised protein [Klebsiella pneumoniae subsp. ozaenae]|uniref:Uncharacterized protein n=1 Tax=Klebsiella pneumoniae subsp. ozaenae TaxID=574 RepID=A0A378ALP5_KLEPO|nr:Uncharacterised protein [Klebsiella pneumoniae subsp. ozaenae]
MGELCPEFTVRIPEGKRNANNAYFFVVHNIPSIASFDYCLHIYNTIKTLFCQLLESLFRGVFNIFNVISFSKPLLHSLEFNIIKSANFYILCIQ